MDKIYKKKMIKMRNFLNQPISGLELLIKTKLLSILTSHLTLSRSMTSK